VSEDIELAAKTTGEVVAALADESGALAVPQEYAHYLAARIHYRYYPKLIERAMTAAERIKASGLPVRAYAALDEPMLTAILEGMAEETDDSLREAWENLLANALTEGSTEVPRAFPRMLSELEPAEAMLLNSIANSQTFTEEPLTRHITVADLADSPVSGVSVESVDNLIRLGILRREEPQDSAFDEQLKRRESQVANLRFTAQGWAFLQACRAPRPRD
jgi:hypothetical protein